MKSYLKGFGLAAAFLLAVDISPVSAAPAAPTRGADEDVNSAGLRQKVGLNPGATMLFNGWGLAPAGQHVRISDLALKMIVSPDRKMLLAVSGGFNDTGLTLIDLKTRQVSQFFPLKEAWNGLAFSKSGARIFVSGGDSGLIHVFNYADGKAVAVPAVKPSAESGEVFLAGIAVHPKTGKLYVCNEANNEVWVLNPETLALEATVPVGPHPHSCLVGGDMKYLYVSNWGGGSVSIVDTTTNRRIRDVAVGLRPNDLALAPDGRMFVACSGDNTVHVIATGTLEAVAAAPSPNRRMWEGTREIISTSLYPQSLEGSTPDALAVSPDGKTLFVANADNNDVMVADISNRLNEDAQKHGETVSVVDGFIPVGWYPSAVAVSPDNQTLFVANGKGLASRPNFPAQIGHPRRTGKGPRFDYIGNTLEGAVSFIARPDAAAMAAFTAQVRKNSPYTPAALTQAPVPSDSVIPARVDNSCPIKYVLYIVKENRTYDQVLGDMTDARGRAIGNGDPQLAIFGAKVTPNQHQILRDYVLLDNLYCNGEVSVDGHSWCDAAIATDFNQRSWIMSYSKHGKLPGNDEMETPANGYLWDLCRRHGLSFRNYGEGALRVPSENRGRWGANFKARDMDKVNYWVDDLHRAEQTGELPRFMVMSLGEDHTQGTTPGAYTPEASVASNDVGIGKIVAAASRSKFWGQMAIFVIEDDAQNGPDHVDAHRTVGFVVSPYCKRGFVDSTLYTTASMVRTMELILGLPPLTQYDAGATPMFGCFQRQAVLTPFEALPPQIDVMAKNTKESPFAAASARMDFSDYDRAPEDELNRILWYSAKPDVAYAAPIHRALFTK